MYELAYVPSVYRTNYAWLDAIQAGELLPNHSFRRGFHFFDPGHLRGSAFVDSVDLGLLEQRDYDGDGVPDARDLDDDNDGDPDTTDPAPRNASVRSEQTRDQPVECCEGGACRNPYCRCLACPNRWEVLFAGVEAMMRIDILA